MRLLRRGERRAAGWAARMCAALRGCWPCRAGRAGPFVGPSVAPPRPNKTGFSACRPFCRTAPAQQDGFFRLLALQSRLPGPIRRFFPLVGPSGAPPGPIRRFFPLVDGERVPANNGSRFSEREERTEVAWQLIVTRVYPAFDLFESPLLPPRRTRLNNNGSSDRLEPLLFGAEKKRGTRESAACPLQSPFWRLQRLFSGACPL